MSFYKMAAQLSDAGDISIDQPKPSNFDFSFRHKLESDSVSQDDIRDRSIENVRRNMHSDSVHIAKFQFAIEDLLPIEASEEKSAEQRAEKMGLRLEKSKSKSVLHSNEISMYMPTHSKLF